MSYFYTAYIWSDPCEWWHSAILLSTRASLMIFRNIRHQLPVAAAKLFMHTMILPHLSYCATSWSHTSITTLKTLYTIYKQAVNILAKKPRSYHHCNIIKNYKRLIIFYFLLMCVWCTNYFMILHYHLLNNVWLSVRIISGRLGHQLEVIVQLNLRKLFLDNQLFQLEQQKDGI